jgi:D-alanyl-D-alanine carboxypeptidase
MQIIWHQKKLKIMIKKIIATFFFGLVFQTGSSQTFDKLKLDRYFQELENAEKFMGSVAIFENGKIIYEKAIGFSEIETKIKPNKNTKYRIGSISKSFTSVLVLKAVEEKKLTLDSKLNVFFPFIKNADKISISNLLNHRSGIHNFTNDPTYFDWNTQKKSEAEMLKIIENGGSDFEPNSKSEYSNSNYVLLSFILEKIYKKSYSTLLTEKIVKPIGLKNTFVGGEINIKNNECYSYKYFTNWEKQTETDMTIPMGAGNIISTPSDLMKFAEALFDGKIISAQSIELMKTTTDNYGFGLFKMSFDDKISYGHTGSIDEFSSIYQYFINEKVGFAFTSNGSNYNNNDIVIVLSNAIFGKNYEIPNFKAYQVATVDLDTYLGIFSCKELPIKITITKKNTKLIAQATGQMALELEATKQDEFKFDKAGIVLEFNPTNKTMLLKQGGGIFTFTKE